MKGTFITFEGSDGAGKTTVLKRVLRVIRPRLGSRLLMTREPGGNPIAEAIRNVILNRHNVKMDAKTEALLYAAARRQHVVQNILPALKRGRLVLCDRYTDSSIAYQGAGRKLGLQAVQRLNDYSTGGLVPDLTIYFDVPVKVGLTRIQRHRQNDIDRLDRENPVFHQRVHAAYQRLAADHPNRIKVINANRPVDRVVASVLRLLKSRGPYL